MNVTLWDTSSDVRKELSIQDDRTESDNRIEVTLLIGIAENNLPHIARWESTKPPYAEPHVRWCGRSVNVKIGGKCLLWLAFTSYPIVLLFMLSLSPFCVCVCRFCRCLKVWCSATILLKRVLVWVRKTSEDGDAPVSLCVLSASLCWKIFLFSCVEQNNIIFLFFCRLLSSVADCLSCYGRQSAWRSFL